MTRTSDDYTSAQLEYGPVYAYFQALTRHVNALDVLEKDEHSSDFIFTIELLHYTVLEMSLKLIHALCYVHSTWDRLPSTQDALHDLIYNKLKDGNHRLDTILTSCLTYDNEDIQQLRDVTIEFQSNQPAGNFYLVKFDDTEVTLNDSFSTRFPGFGRGGGEVSVVWVMPKRRTVIDAVFKVAHSLCNSYRARAYSGASTQSSSKRQDTDCLI